MNKGTVKEILTRELGNKHIGRDNKRKRKERKEDGQGTPNRKYCKPCA